MMVASISTAIAAPTPNCLTSSTDSVPNSANTPTITTAALVTTPAVERMPVDTASGVDIPPSTSSFTLLRMKTW